MYYSGLNKCDTANGPGVRVSLFVSGCTLNCTGCFNPEAHCFTYGSPFTEETKQEILKALADEAITGFSLLGGDPMEPEHQEVLLDLLHSIKEKYPHKNIWCWTGRVLEHLNSPLLDYIDTLVDGPFVKKKTNISLEWRGSSNQRIINLVH